MGRKKRGQLLCGDTDTTGRLFSVENAVHTTARAMCLKEEDAIRNNERLQELADCGMKKSSSHNARISTLQNEETLEELARPRRLAV